MKKITLLIIILLFTACTTQEVRMTDPELEMKGFELYYQDEPFTGTLIQQIPFTDDELKIKYKNGIISGQ